MPLLSDLELALLLFIEFSGGFEVLRFQPGLLQKVVGHFGTTPCFAVDYQRLVFREFSKTVSQSF